MLRSSALRATAMVRLATLQHYVATGAAQRAFSLSAPVQMKRARAGATPADSEPSAVNLLDKDDIKLMASMEKHVRAVLDAKVQP